MRRRQFVPPAFGDLILRSSRGHYLSSDLLKHPGILIISDPSSEPESMTRLGSRASSTSHSVAAVRSRTNIPLAAGRAQDNETILERRHLAMDRVGSSTWIRQGS
ncbi:hypothetical protein [Ensifer aridi]|uniref:hypothetical protein n=1 Tax=Ensifer aridi TaxID=1708715 RepID=UPI000A10C2CA|nr:hypothetical protein [Ensifer aridi]